MSKRKPATALKRARNPKKAARAQRTKQAVVRSPRDDLHSVAAAAIERHPKLHDDPKRAAPLIETVRSPKDDVLHSVAEAAIERPLKLHNDPKPDAPLIEPRVDALPGDLSQRMRDSDSTTGLALATANLQAYQAKLLEIAQANGQFAFEFGLRLAAIRSPIEFFAVVTEFSSRRIDMFGQHSREIAAYPFWRIEASRRLTTLPGR
ncbi:hypothetical protein M2171_005186 [Bradyrhizobium japonicum USDA 38]|uniref:Phasin protein n=1 Tax=Bradyrhizobium japonicum TaxID=375 RepID=UPI00048619D0|nr:Phasin protein [Bradyrhizobium japonicum]MBR0766484.1 Phasin protein [Bradyrhizobium japonicum]MCS3896053.1 hypothetical protein [Bradyrhizobium japonicum USDA 38]MCS3948567.1 hypothetical protein [Bradyrhizobium japonicum]